MFFIQREASQMKSYNHLEIVKSKSTIHMNIYIIQLTGLIMAMGSQS